MTILKRLLIISVYAPSPYNDIWYRLQKFFINKNTTVPYDFRVVVNEIDSSLFKDEEIIKINDENIGHPAGIRQALEYMRGSKDYDRFLLLDSDCFPVRSGWDSILFEQMKKFSKLYSAPIRFENLDLFPHPCVVYMNKEGLSNKKLNFDYAETPNLMGDSINEVGGLMTEIRDEVMPLIRTNRINLHPVAAGIYHHMFYHHGAGSRGFGFRVTREYFYYDHWIDLAKEEKYGEELIRELARSPEGYIDKLLYGY